MSLKTTIEGINRNYRNSIVEAVKGASSSELLELFGLGDVTTTVAEKQTPKKRLGAMPTKRARRQASGKRNRRASEAVNDLAGRISEAVHALGGASISQIAAHLGVDKSSLARPMKLALAGGNIRMEGDRRFAKYIAA